MGPLQLTSGEKEMKQKIQMRGDRCRHATRTTLLSWRVVYAFKELKLFEASVRLLIKILAQGASGVKRCAKSTKQ